MTDHREDPALAPFLAMVDKGVSIGELFKEELLEKIQRDSIIARLSQGPRPRPIYFQVPR